MHDHSLDSRYDDTADHQPAPSHDGVPLHSGPCDDGTYGCSHCNAALRYMPPERVEAYGFSATLECEACHRAGPRTSVRETRPWDEPSCTYLWCADCRAKDRAELRELEDEVADYETDDVLVCPWCGDSTPLFRTVVIAIEGPVQQDPDDDDYGYSQPDCFEVCRRCAGERKI